jgi:hypothetical protein
VITFSMCGLRVKAFDHFGLDDGDMLRRHPLGDVVAELLYPLGLLHYLRWFDFACFLYL